jgi:hypothetical protein
VSQSLLFFRRYYDYRKPKNMPVDGASYMVGRTDERYYEKAK